MKSLTIIKLPQLVSTSGNFSGANAARMIMVTPNADETRVHRTIEYLDTQGRNMAISAAIGLDPMPRLAAR